MILKIVKKFLYFFNNSSKVCCLLSTKRNLAFFEFPEFAQIAGKSARFCCCPCFCFDGNGNAINRQQKYSTRLNSREKSDL